MRLCTSAASVASSRLRKAASRAAKDTCVSREHRVCERRHATLDMLLEYEKRMALTGVLDSKVHATSFRTTSSNSVRSIPLHCFQLSALLTPSTRNYADLKSRAPGQRAGSTSLSQSTIVDQQVTMVLPTAPTCLKGLIAARQLGLKQPHLRAQWAQFVVHSGQCRVQTAAPDQSVTAQLFVRPMCRRSDVRMTTTALRMVCL